MESSHNRSIGRRFTLGFGMCAVLVAFSACSNRGNVRVGGACTIDQSCGTAVCIRESKSSHGRAWIGGYCSGNCSVNECPQGRCLDLADGYSYCVSECTSTSDCRQGYVCSPDAKACLPDCRLGWSCGSSLTCDTSNGACTGPKVTPQPLGSPCTLNAGCEGGLCIPQSSSSSGTVWTGGTCTQDCAASACPSGSTCFTFLDGTSRCLTACSGPTCRQDYVCSSDAKVCLPDCRLGWACGNLICDRATGECEDTVVTDAGAKPDTLPASTDAARDTTSAPSGHDAFTPGPGGAGGGGGGMGPGGPGGRT